MSKEYQINLTEEEILVVLKVLEQATHDYQGYISEQEDALIETGIIMDEENADQSRREHCIGGCQLNLDRLIKEKKEYVDVGTKFERVYFDQHEYSPYFMLIPRESN